jgi:hypothetical protein
MISRLWRLGDHGRKTVRVKFYMHRPPGLITANPTLVLARVANEVEVLRWCIDWLAQLERGEMVVVNLRPDTEDITEFVRFDQARVRRVLARIAADLDALARPGPATDTERPEEPTDPRTRHRRRLAESAEMPRGRTAKAQREALRRACGLAPYGGDYAEYFRQTRGLNM